MEATVGDRIRVYSETKGGTPREGEVLAVLPSPAGTSYRVRWSDGHETTIRPFPGSVEVRARKDQPAIDG